MLRIWNILDVNHIKVVSAMLSIRTLGFSSIHVERDSLTVINGIKAVGDNFL